MRLPVRACVHHKGAKEDKDFEIAGARGDEYGQITEYNRNRQSTIAATIQQEQEKNKVVFILHTSCGCETLGGDHCSLTNHVDEVGGGSRPPV
eukprot:scaffold12404_cov146-Isochrysis_galbana.AAC.1